MNVGVLGGTFNPPHIGHLILAQCALEELALDSVLFVPAYISPFKAEQPAVDAELRCEMVELAIVDHPRFVCERCEVERRSVSYTVDTLAHLRATRPRTRSRTRRPSSPCRASTSPPRRSARARAAADRSATSSRGR
jgi:nicotinate-nucleotide adenylyltransferase